MSKGLTVERSCLARVVGTGVDTVNCYGALALPGGICIARILRQTSHSNGEKDVDPI